MAQTTADLKTHLDWAMLYQGVVEELALGKVASYSVGGNTFSYTNLRFYEEQLRYHTAMAKRDEGGGGVALADMSEA